MSYHSLGLSDQNKIENRTFIYLGGTVLCAAPLLRAPKVLRVDLDSIPHLKRLTYMTTHGYVKIFTCTPVSTITGRKLTQNM